MAEISSGSLAPNQSAITPPASQPTPRGLDGTAREERAVRSAEESAETDNNPTREAQERRRARDQAESEQRTERAAEERDASRDSRDERHNRVDVRV